MDVTDLSGSLKRSSLLFFGALCLLLAACDDNGSGDSGRTQSVFIYADFADYYYDGNYEYYQDNTEIWGVLQADPMPAFIVLEVNDEAFAGNEYSEILPGYLRIGGDDHDIRVLSDLDHLVIEVQTTFGPCGGSIFLPDPIADFENSAGSSMEIGEPLTLYWVGSDADFYYVTLSFETSYPYTNVTLDAFVQGNSATFSGVHFMEDGSIYNIGVTPINGPLPTEGAEGNMDGFGTGFLYYMAETERNWESIPVGSGYGSPSTGNLPIGNLPTDDQVESAESVNKARTSHTIQQRIRETIVPIH
jgi:hypothetical protein